MSDVPSNLIPTRITQLPVAPVADENSLMMIVYQGNNYQIRVGDLLSVAGVPTSTQVIAGTGLAGGGQLTGNVTLSVAVGGIGNTQLADTGVTSGTYGDATNIPVFTVDAKGRIQAATTIPASGGGGVPTTTQVIAGTGLNGGGQLTGNVTLNANLSNALPLLTDGLGSAGVSTDISRADHQHPSVNLQDSDEVDGILSVANGGTSRSLVPSAGAIIWSGADGLYVGPVGVAGQVLVSDGTNEYNWADQQNLDVGQADNINGGTANQLLYQTAVNTTGFVPAPTLSNTVLYWNGTNLVWGSVPGTGTVTSVGLALPADFAISGSPVTGSGTLTGAWLAQPANRVLSGPTTGADATPTFRALVNADLPASGVTANTYGSSTAIPVVTVNSKGVITSVTTASFTGGLSYQGSWNASTNTPTLTSSVGVNGYYYIVSVAGSTNLNGITDWQVGDWAIFNGSTWQKIDQTNLVSSVNGQTGVVVLTQTDIAGTASLTTTQTLTNKTLTSPSINEILDANGNEILGLSTTASAVDFLTIKNGIGVGVPLHLYADGSSTNVGLHIQPKGSGLVTISDGTDFNKGIRFRSSGSAASAVTLLDAVATAGRVVTLPDATTTLVGRDTTDTLTNKTINLTSNTLVATSAELASAVSDETGSGSLVFATSPTLVTPILGTPQSGNFSTGTFTWPTFNQNTTGTAAGLSTTLAIGSGGTGQTTAGAAFNALSPITTTGDLILGNGTNSATRLGIGTDGYLLTVVGGTAAWAAAPAAGVTSFAGGTTGLTPASATTGAITLAGTLAIANGGTNSTATATAGGAAYGTGTAYAFTAAGTAGQVLTSAGTSAPAWGGINGGTF
jgi:hypothetical protein